MKSLELDARFEALTQQLDSAAAMNKECFERICMKDGMESPSVTRLSDGRIILSIFDGTSWHREIFASNDDLYIWAYRNGVEIDGIVL